MKVLSVLGTRPEGIKMAPVIRELQRHSADIESRVCVTGQHRQMLDQVLDLFGLQPDYDLNLMRDKQSLSSTAAAVLLALEPVLDREKPDWVLVQGDTTTVVAAAVAASYAGVKVGHVEAGLRTYDKLQPFPEEVNRRIAGVVADLHFAPTERARDNLLREFVSEDTVIVTGNPVIDALKIAGDMNFSFQNSPISTIPHDKRLILVTMHRRENHGAPLNSICNALRAIAQRYEDTVHIAYLVHLNPRIWGPVHERLSDLPNISLLPPVEYLSLVNLIKQSFMVLTDSGGLQEEAPSFGKPVLVLRNTTERPEAVESGNAKLVGHEYATVLAAVEHLLNDSHAYTSMSQTANPFGDGFAAQRIVTGLQNATPLRQGDYLSAQLAG